jgi:lipopolysaccharide export system permease protein
MKKLDGYILRQVAATFIFSICGLCVIFVVVHLLENLDGFLDKKTPPRVIAVFYLNYLPEIVKLITPVAMLLSSLFTIGRLSNTNEITAMKTGGMSVYRIMSPLLLFGAAVSGAQMYFNGWVVPKANQYKAEVERKFLQKGRLETSLYNIYLRDAPLRNVMIRFYDDVTKTGNYLSIEEYSSEQRPRLTRRVDAQVFRFDTLQSSWRLTQAMEHRFFTSPSGTDTLTSSVINDYTARLNIKPRELFQLQRGTEEMTFPELREYINLSERGGKDVRQQRIEYFGLYAFPFSNFIVTLFGVLPLAAAAGQRKSGLALEIASAMVIAFLYMACVKIGQSLALASPLPPEVGAWLANGIFFLAGLVLALRMRT